MDTRLKKIDWETLREFFNNVIDVNRADFSKYPAKLDDKTLRNNSGKLRERLLSDYVKYYYPQSDVDDRDLKKLIQTVAKELKTKSNKRAVSIKVVEDSIKRQRVYFDASSTWSMADQTFDVEDSNILECSLSPCVAEKEALRKQLDEVKRERDELQKKLRETELKLANQQSATELNQLGPHWQMIILKCMNWAVSIRNVRNIFLYLKDHLTCFKHIHVPSIGYVHSVRHVIPHIHNKQTEQFVSEAQTFRVAFDGTAWKNTKQLGIILFNENVEPHLISLCQYNGSTSQEYVQLVLKELNAYRNVIFPRLLAFVSDTEAATKAACRDLCAIVNEGEREEVVMGVKCTWVACGMHNISNLENYAFKCLPEEASKYLETFSKT